MSIPISTAPHQCKRCHRSAETLREGFATNCLGAHLTTQAFLPLLQQGPAKTVANISSSAGSNTRYSSLVRPCLAVDSCAHVCEHAQGCQRERTCFCVCTLVPTLHVHLLACAHYLSTQCQINYGRLLLRAGASAATTSHGQPQEQHGCLQSSQGSPEQHHNQLGMRPHARHRLQVCCHQPWSDRL